MIYVVEDDPGIRELSLYALNNAGLDCLGFGCAGEFFAECEQRLPSLVLLDIMLPDQDGTGILAALRGRRATEQVPVIMVTAKDSELDKVKALDAGADDYIVKPFSVMELVSRVRSLLRRASHGAQAQTLLTHEDIALDFGRRQVTVDGQDCQLTYKEYELLKLLMTNEGLVLTRDQMLDKVWEYDYQGETRTVDAHIKTLRKKLGDSGDAIKTVRGVGYKLAR